MPIRSLRLKRVAFLTGIFLLNCGISACGTIKIAGGDVGSIYEMTSSVWNGERHKVTIAEAQAVPYASMGVRVGDGPQGLIVLAGDSGGGRLWTSASHIAIQTRNGRIVRTAGLPKNLSGHQKMVSAAQGDLSSQYKWLADFRDIGLYSMPISCTDKFAGSAKITILGKDIETKRIDETCQSDSKQLDWTFHNVFWVDAVTGFTWRSIQSVHPNMDPVEIEILRPPA